MRYGWRPQLPDHRDISYAPTQAQLEAASQALDAHQVIDLRTSGFMPAIYDQQNLGSCHDAETEVLTDCGWLPFPDLTVASLSSM